MRAKALICFLLGEVAEEEMGITGGYWGRTCGALLGVTGEGLVTVVKGE
jgi:hypothetical protein